ncbi:HD-GYP domain-containing protein [Alicyclobacillus acidocaldarius]|uniref:HD-GYP domain-containing protein n=1 Tax=Alicyclobacillus acidocaldarius TaxID=405212 RepID=UPI00187335AA|nr:HD domain-containing phosphohydrolase [Alicyclobacillus acidocaldarius]
MVELEIGDQGTIGAVRGDLESILGFKPDEIRGLPSDFLHTDLAKPGLHTLWMRCRNGEPTLLHAFAIHIEGRTSVYLAPVFDEHSLEVKFAYQSALFRGLAFAAEYGDPELLNHLARVERYTIWIAKDALQWSQADVARITLAAYVHDVGKSAIPREILYKPARLTPEEYRLVQTHTQKGRDVLTQIEAYVQQECAWLYDEKGWQWAKDVALHHHENWDGTGYPVGVSGESIPLVARVVKLVDVLDALLEARPYKEGWPLEKVRREIDAKKGVEFDPYLAEWLLAQDWNLIREIACRSPMRVEG